MTSQKFLQTQYLAYPKLEPQEIDLILALSYHRPVEYLYRYPNKNLSSKQIKIFNQLLKRYLQNWSIAHLQGYKYFFGLKFLVNRHTLIPRPDSELLVEHALNYLKKQKNKSLNIVDIGTGSGCLILSVAKNYSPAALYLGLDISSPALKIARTNARKLGLKNKVTFKKSNLLAKAKGQKFDLILANLPYLKPLQLKEASIQKEPRSALLSGNDGLDHYQRLLKNIAPYLKKKYLILLEIDPQQTNEIIQLIKKYLPQTKINISKDLAGFDRLVSIIPS